MKNNKMEAAGGGLARDGTYSFMPSKTADMCFSDRNSPKIISQYDNNKMKTSK